MVPYWYRFSSGDEYTLIDLFLYNCADKVNRQTQEDDDDNTRIPILVTDTVLSLAQIFQKS